MFPLSSAFLIPELQSHINESVRGTLFYLFNEYVWTAN
jgi:hypothetical protein